MKVRLFHAHLVTWQAATMLLLPTVCTAQTQAEAIEFLQGSFSMESFRKPMQVSVTCTQVRMQYEWEGQPRIVYQFDPRAVTLSPYVVTAGDTPHSARISCLTGACVMAGDATLSGRLERIGSANPYTNQIDASRVARAFQFFQNSCGGPYRSHF